MRINSFEKVNQLYKTNSANKTKKSNAYGGSDKVQISQMGKDFQIAKTAVKNSSDIRTDKVMQLRDKWIKELIMYLTRT